MPIELYSQKQTRLAKAGEPDVYQYHDFSETFRRQVIYIWGRSLDMCASAYVSGQSQMFAFGGDPVWDPIQSILAEEYGMSSLSEKAFSSQKCRDFLLNCEPDQVLDIIEFTFQTIEALSTSMPQYMDTNVRDEAISDLNHRFQQHSLGFEYVNGQLIKKSTDYIHAQAVKPALSLLTMPGFSGPSDEFLRAHGHFLKGEYQDAILDANNAFESTMKAICDLRLWTYDKTATAKPLNEIMFHNDLIPRSLTNHFDHLRLVLEAGLPTVRNKTGGHGQGSTPLEIPEHLAAYALHLAASNIVLLVEAHKAKP